MALPDDRPSAVRNALASLLAPNWMLGLLLFACLFLPGYRGCNDEVIRVNETFGEVNLEVGSIYVTFLITWPFLFGLVVAVGTLRLAVGRGPASAGLLWYGMAALILVNAALLPLALLSAAFASGAGMLIAPPSILALALLPITTRRAEDRLSAATWVQLYLGATAAVSVTFLAPALLWAKEVLAGGKLAVVCSVLLILGSMVQLFDGRRALNRRRGDSPLQLSLGQTLLLMLVGGPACAWILAVLIG